VPLQLADPERVSVAVHPSARVGESAACGQGRLWDPADSAVRQGLPFVSAFWGSLSMRTATATLWWSRGPPRRCAHFLRAYAYTTTWRMIDPHI